MFISKIHLGRRTLLKGMGASIGLPFLDAMIPAASATANTAATPQLRMAFVYFPHGAVMDQWTPQAEGASFELPPILAPLAPFKKHLTIVSGLANKAAVANPVHAITPATWLSCVAPQKSHAPHGAITVDQIAAQRLGADTPFASLEVATESEGGEGAIDQNYGASYGKTISFASATAPLPMEHDPEKLFRLLFAVPQKRPVVRPASILDLVRPQTHDLKRTLGPRDRALIDDYLTRVRDVELRARTLAERSSEQLATAVMPAFDARMHLMFDMIALAFQANLTRVATFMMAAEVSNQAYDFIGIPDGFHSLSHHANDPAKLARLARVQTFNTQVFAEFVSKLAATPDGEGSLLDHALVLFGSNMSNSNLHDHSPLPCAVVGGGCGTIRGNQHLRYADRAPLANLHLTLLNRAGVPLERLGDSTGQFAEI